MDEQNIIIYNTVDGKAKVTLMAKDGQVWMNQGQLAELFATSVPNINIHIGNILQDRELTTDSVIKDYLITATDGKQYNVKFYSLDMILAMRVWVQRKELSICKSNIWLLSFCIYVPELFPSILFKKNILLRYKYRKLTVFVFKDL